MNLQRTRIRIVTFAFLAIVTTGVFAAGVQAAILPLRSGTVVSKTDAGVFTYIKAIDDAGKEFWVLTSICTIGEKGKIAVLAGTHYDKVKTELHGILQDVYTGDQVKLGEADVVGFGAHGLPAGCVLLE